jgi:hypothetical protein
MLVLITLTEENKMKVRFDTHTKDVDAAASAFVRLAEMGVTDVTLSKNTWGNISYNLHGDIHVDNISLLTECCPKPAWNDDASEL